MSATSRLAFPFISPGQAQKELYHNEALQLLDVLVAAAVEGLPTAAPPATPTIGLCYIVGGSSSGDWSGRAQQLAAYTSGGWRFIAPRDGMSALVRSSGGTAVTGAARGKSERCAAPKSRSTASRWWARAARRSRLRRAAARPTWRQGPRSARSSPPCASTDSSKRKKPAIGSDDLQPNRKQLRLFGNSWHQQRPCADTGALIMC